MKHIRIASVPGELTDKTAAAIAEMLDADALPRWTAALEDERAAESQDGLFDCHVASAAFLLDLYVAGHRDARQVTAMVGAPGQRMKHSWVEWQGCAVETSGVLIRGICLVTPIAMYRGVKRPSFVKARTAERIIHEAQRRETK